MALTHGDAPTDSAPAAPAAPPDRPIRADDRLSDAETLMWSAERDPHLRSSFLSLTLLDRPPEWARFRRRMAAAGDRIERLHQRVVGPPGGVGRPRWAEDPDFDLDYHVRRVVLPQPGTDRQLLDLASHCYQDPFDVARPPWRFVVVEGLEGGRAALLAKMHHTISDGVGAIRLSAMFVDLEPDPAAPPAARDGEDVAPSPGAPIAGNTGLAARVAGGVGDAADVAAELARVPWDLVRRTVSGLIESLSHPLSVPGHAIDSLQSARSVLGQIATPAGSPLWSGRRSMGRAFEIFSFDADRARTAAHAMGATLNDLYVAGIVGGAGDYHRAQGTPVEELRASIPISTRTDRSAGGNSFLPARVSLPAGIEDPVKRLAAVHERLVVLKSTRSAGWADALAGVLAWLPPDLIVRLARSQVDTVDFAASNVRGAPFDLYIAGAHILANHPFGPTGGTAFNATVLSYRSTMDVGLNVDTNAVADPGLLRACLVDSIDSLIAAGA
jgi:diacylglycerol O-acyltransferase / wax synthase